MMTQLKDRLRKRESSDPPLIRLLKLLLRECVETYGADTVVFGAPPDDLPRDPLYPNEKRGEDDCCHPVFATDSSGTMPVWYRVGGRWKEVERIPFRIIPEFIGTLADYSSEAEESYDLDRTHVLVDESEPTKKYVQYRLCIESNFCFSMHITEVLDIPR
jgi:hypothetical protein